MVSQDHVMSTPADDATSGAPAPPGRSAERLTLRAISVVVFVLAAGLPAALPAMPLLAVVAANAIALATGLVAAVLFVVSLLGGER